MNRKIQVEYVGTQGEVTYQSGPNYDYLFETSVVKSDKYNVGDRVVLPDGSVYRYSKAGAAIDSSCLDYALYFAIGARNKWYENPTQGQAAGDKSITLPFDEAYSNAGASITVAKDELAGGYIVIYKNGVSNQCVRRIIGNTASETASPYKVTIYLDGPLPYAVVVADGVELIASPYSDMRSCWASPSNTVTFGGFAEIVVASGAYFWLKTRGIHRGAQRDAPAAYQRSLYFGNDGYVCQRGDVGTNVTDQRAGILITGGASQAAFFLLDVDK